MYSQLIIDQKLRKARQSGINIRRRPVEDSIAITEKLTALIDPKTDKMSREFTREEHEFIKSERTICACDFRYFGERYGCVQQDASEGGGVAPIRFWESQLISLRITAKREEEMWAEYNKHGITPGILQVDHKVRQVGRTALTRLMLMHRMITRKFYRGLSATIASPDDKNKFVLYNYDKTIYDNLPFFLKPPLLYDVKKELLQFGGPGSKMKSLMTYTDSEQRAGIGTGSQVDGHHISEVGLWEHPERLKFEFLPAVPRGPWTLGIWESTPAGRHNFWHELTEAVRNKKRGYEHWIYCYTPWYLLSKYRSPAPDSWIPDEATQKHAQIIERTSPEFNEGQTFHPSRDQLYWWETTREFHRTSNQLNVFYSNYSATPEESFQHANSRGLPFATIEWMRQTSQLGMPYEVAYRQMTGAGL